MRRVVVIGSAVFAIPAMANAQDFSAAQALNEQYATQVLTALESGNAEALARIDFVIEYSAGPAQPQGQSVTSDMAVEMFARCQAPAVDAADQFRDFMTLKFSCPDRQPPNPCVTGDLNVMLFPGSPVSIGISERANFSDPACLPSAPPSPPPRRSK